MSTKNLICKNPKCGEAFDINLLKTHISNSDYLNDHPGICESIEDEYNCHTFYDQCACGGYLVENSCTNTIECKFCKKYFCGPFKISHDNTCNTLRIQKLEEQVEFLLKKLNKIEI